MSIHLSYQDIANMAYMFSKKKATKELLALMERRNNSENLEAFTKLKAFVL